jgi:hypothetical protein
VTAAISPAKNREHRLDRGDFRFMVRENPALQFPLDGKAVFDPRETSGILCPSLFGFGVAS